jgi:hypothetical protein
MSFLAPVQREEIGLAVVKTVAGKLIRGQKPFIEMEDLLHIGNVQMLRTIDRPYHPTGKVIPLDKRIARDVKTIMLRFIKKQEREYQTQGDAGGSHVKQPWPLAFSLKPQPNALMDHPEARAVFFDAMAAVRASAVVQCMPGHPLHAAYMRQAQQSRQRQRDYWEKNIPSCNSMVA